MKINFHEFEKKNYLNNNIYDYIIIGSGPAAVTLYKKILSINKRSQILMIEQGDFKKKSFKGVSSKYLKIKLKSRAFTVGGTSSIWSNISSYFEEFEMISRWRNKKEYLWPLKYNSLLKMYNEIDNKYEFHFKKLKKKKINIPFEVRPFIATTRPKNFKKFINEKEIDLVYNCKINSIDENKKIAIAYSKNNKINFKAKKIIVCCGGIESVNLIQNSITQKKLKNIKNKNLIGKFFMDHPKFNLGYLKYPNLDTIKQIELKKTKDIIFYYGISLKKATQKKNNVLNTYVRFEKSNSKLYRLLNKLNISIFNRILQNKPIYKVRLFCEMMPNINNHIISKKEEIFVNFKFSKIDMKTIKLLSLKIKNFFSYKPEKEKNFKVDLVKNIIDDASHHMGGLRYNHNKNLSNVDRNLKLIGLKNIYICSSAIFPTSGSVNPTMTICALSNRLGKHLNKKFR